MTANPEPIVQPWQDDFQNLLVDVTGLEARAQTAYAVELTLFRRRLAMGAVLLWNRSYMRDDEYQASGWPIGTGVVEGTCGHLVKDRMEQAGMRWTQAGAQGVLDLRAVRLSGHGDTSWQ